MPNHVFNHISVEEQYADKLQEIAKVGLCRYYRPMPEELTDSVSGSENAKPEWQKQRSKELKEKYGSDNWYDWAINNWGTKWGCYEPFGEDTAYNFQTAWSPPSREIFEMLAKDIPDFYYEWEEEQGYGAMWNCIDGELELEYEWDLPNWNENKWSNFVGDLPDEERERLYGYECITYLPNEYRNMHGTYKRGYYLDYLLEEFLANDFKTAVARLKDRQEKSIKLREQWEKEKTN